MKCRSLIFLTFISILFNTDAAQVQAQDTSRCPKYPSTITLKVIDRLTVVCKSKDPNFFFPGKAIDEITLYRDAEGSSTAFNLTLTVYEDSTKLITIFERRNSKTAQFYLVGRKFQKWALIGQENPAMLNKYRKYVTTVLDAYENTLLEDTEF